MGFSHRSEAQVKSKMYTEIQLPWQIWSAKIQMNANNFFKTALFLDRDGIVNRDFGYVYEKEKLELVDGIIELIDFFSHELDHIIVVSNQSGIGRGCYSYEDWETFN